MGRSVSRKAAETVDESRVYFYCISISFARRIEDRRQCRKQNCIVHGRRTNGFMHWSRAVFISTAHLNTKNKTSQLPSYPPPSPFA
jgi:hypothetical protein